MDSSNNIVTVVVLPILVQVQQIQEVVEEDNEVILVTH